MKGKNLLGAMITGAALLAAAPAVRADEPRPTVWHCWYDNSDGHYIRCVSPASAPGGELEGDDELQALRSALLSVGQEERATRLVRVMPHAFPGTVRDIPIYTAPYGDLNRSLRLVAAVLCRRTPCRLAYDPSPRHAGDRSVYAPGLR